MTYLVDSNILVRLRDLDSPERAVCEQVVQLSLQQGVRLYLCAQSLIEFWAVSTRPREANGLGLDTQQVFVGVTTIVRTLPLLPEPADIAGQWLHLVRQYAVKGKEVHDARLVAFAVAHQIRDILTLNPDDFTRYREVTAWTPEQLMERMTQGG